MRHGDDNSSMKTAWGGLSGLQYQLAATWTASKLVTEEENTNANSFSRERIYSTITEQDMAEWWSVAPAKLAGLDVDRGCIEAGKRADFVLWDTSYVGRPNEYCQEYHRWKGDCVYSTKHDLCGRVVGTWLKGVHVYDGWKDEILRDDQGRYIESAAIQ
jgi:dihydroorotase-like cyclic amidohydrolase